MTRWQALVFQARSDLAIFDVLARAEAAVPPECHPLHYLQMATEKLAKALFIALDVAHDPYSHVAFSLLPRLLARQDIAAALGQRDFQSYRRFLQRTAPLFRAIDELNPSVGIQQPGGGSSDGPNVEYPWERRDRDGAPEWVAPAAHDFGVLAKLQRSGDGARMLAFVRVLLDRFPSLIG